jgi:hypothetical protein
VKVLATYQLETFNVNVAWQRFERGTHHNVMPVMQRKNKQHDQQCKKGHFLASSGTNDAILF